MSASGAELDPGSSRVHLRAGGVSVLLELNGGALPTVAHWGADLGPLDPAMLDAVVRAARSPEPANGIPRPVSVGLLPEAWTGWAGTPGVAGHRPGGRDWSPRFAVTGARLEALGGAEGGGDTGDRPGRLVVAAEDLDTRLGLELVVELAPTGVLRARATLTNRSDEPYVVDGVTLTLPVPPVADQILDLAGRWSAERSPQRRALVVGSHVREGRHGRTGADAPLVTVVGPSGFGFRSGPSWGVHVAWSGNHRTLVERLPTGAQLVGGGELLLPGEVELSRGESYLSPWLYASYGEGMDELAGRFHDSLRARPHHPRTPRPVTLNTFEAVYFDHDPDRLRELADLAAKVGVERFVLDDGWFLRRHDDTAGLGDWFVDDTVWPTGLTPLVERVHDLGMQFGLWVEPEMVSPDSDLARAHPDWVLQVPGRMPLEARHQQVLDVARAEVWDYLCDRLVTLVREHGVDCLKWDHNRDLVDAGSPRTGHASVHEQTLATYRLVDAVRAACPGLEIESCSSGGARVDLAVLERADRVWASDCLDAHERQQIQRWTAQLLPPELVGAHVGSPRNQITGRVLDLSFRAGTALFGHFGIEWDLTTAADDELEVLRQWVGLYQQLRGLLHSGRTVRQDLPGGVWLHGVVARDRGEALYAVVGRERPASWPPGSAPLPGLDPARSYRIRPVGPALPDDPRVVPGWWDTDLVLPGSVLGSAGLQLPALEPDHLALVHVTAVEKDEA